MHTDQRKRRIAYITANVLFVAVFALAIILAYLLINYPAETDLGVLLNSALTIGIPAVVAVISAKLLSYSTSTPLRRYTGTVIDHEVIEAFDAADTSAPITRLITSTGQILHTRPTIHYPKNWRILVRLDDTGEEVWRDHRGLPDVHERFPVGDRYDSQEAWSTAERTLVY